MDVIGSDNRTRVTATTTYPNRAIGLLRFNDPAGNPRRCTAWLYDESTVATAGHCVYTHDNTNNIHGWNSGFLFYPGRNADQSPYGSCGWTTAYSVNGWTADNNAEYDYGALVLNCSVGTTVGWFGLHWQSASYDGTSVTVRGYPGDKTPTYSMWTHSGPITSSATRQLFYQIDTAGGQSGSPVYMPGCGTYCGIADHAYGRYGGSNANRGTRITEAAFNNYLNWRP